MKFELLINNIYFLVLSIHKMDGKKLIYFLSFPFLILFFLIPPIPWLLFIYEFNSIKFFHIISAQMEVESLINTTFTCSPFNSIKKNKMYGQKIIQCLPFLFLLLVFLIPPFQIEEILTNLYISFIYIRLIIFMITIHMFCTWLLLLE